MKLLAMDEGVQLTADERTVRVISPPFWLYACIIDAVEGL